MDRFKNLVLIAGALFFGFLLLINSTGGIAQMLFMALIYAFRKPLRFALRLIAKRDFILVVIFGTLFGLVEEILWFMSEPGIQKTMFSSLYVDLASMLPAYFIFYLVVYFLAESGILGFQFGGIPGAPLPLILVWEINNFFLNGLLVWFPLYISGLLRDAD